MLHITSYSPEETEQAAQNIIAPLLRAGDILAYTGGLGAGKTAFTRGLCRGLHIEAPVSSPTFALVNAYRGTHTTLYHFDMYRVTTPEDLYSTGFFDYLDLPGAILAIEWSENIPFALTMPHIAVSIEILEDDVRKITIAGDERF